MTLRVVRALGEQGMKKREVILDGLFSGAP